MLAIVGITVAAVPVSAAGPNVVVILADDLGFSDLGCYGGEIDTPHLDRLAAGGLRFTQGYNTARCWPTRGAILTGYYPQAIRRDVTWERAVGPKRDQPSARPIWARLLPELLASAGYRSYHSGKWHVDGEPLRQGFARSLQIDSEQNDYFDPEGITVDGKPIEGGKGFYVTTAVGDHAVECLREHASTRANQPFFQYIAFTAPHFPLQAPPPLIEKYRQRYRAGWNAVQQARADRLRQMDIVTTAAAAMERDVGPPSHYPDAFEIIGAGELNRPLPWEELSPEQQELQIAKMSIHAAMVDAMDQAVGRLVSQLDEMHALENTLIIFASDNGASAEIRVRGKGHDRSLPPGSPGTYLCLGPGWSSCANTPFRRHKSWVHEGGIATPWIVCWPRGISGTGQLRTQPVHVIDVVPTVLDVAGVATPREHAGRPVPPLHGRSLLKTFADTSVRVHDSLWWSHSGNRAVRVGDWKLVAAHGTPWELYNVAADRCETKNLAASEQARVADLEATWNRIAEECRTLAVADSAAEPVRPAASAVP